MGFSFKNLNPMSWSVGGVKPLAPLGNPLDGTDEGIIGGKTIQTKVIDPLTGKAAEDAAKRAAELQQTATDRATAENARQFNIGQTNLAPWLKAGGLALDSQQALMGLGPQGTPTNTLAELMKDPGYQFRLTEGQNALNNKLGAMGSRSGSRAMRGMVDYNQGFASQEYGNRLNQLAALSGTGQSTGNTMASNGMNFANNQGNLWTNNANAQGASGIAGANSRQSGLYGLLNLGAKAFGMS
jgi:hypothetical protein